MEVGHLVKQTDKESFEGTLQFWFDKRQDFLNERTINPIATKSFYTHKRLRDAYRSLLRLFTWYANIEFNTPNTINAMMDIYGSIRSKFCYILLSAISMGVLFLLSIIIIPSRFPICINCN